MTNTAYNVYGDCGDDVHSKTYGLSITSQRLDDLDRACLDFVKTANRDLHCLDIGCGEGAMSRHMADLGARVTAIDLEAPEEDTSRPNLVFIKQDMRDIDWKSLGPIDAVYSQRALDFITYRELENLLDKAFSALTPGSSAFLATAGLNCEYGLTYPHRNRPPEERFHVLAPDMAEKHGIRAKICLLDEDEFAAVVNKAGFAVGRVWLSAFGHVKGVFRKEG